MSSFIEGIMARRIPKSLYVNISENKTEEVFLAEPMREYIAAQESVIISLKKEIFKWRDSFDNHVYVPSSEWKEMWNQLHRLKARLKNRN